MAYYSDSMSSTDSGDEAGYDPLQDDTLPGYNMSEDDSDSLSRDIAPATKEPQQPTVMAARAYQLEMLEASLQQNTIVAVSPECP